MKKITLPVVAFIASISLSGCGLMEDAFKAGLIFALVIVAIIGLLVWILRLAADNLNKKYLFITDRKSDKFLKR